MAAAGKARPATPCREAVRGDARWDRIADHDPARSSLLVSGHYLAERPLGLLDFFVTWGIIAILVAVRDALTRYFVPRERRVSPRRLEQGDRGRGSGDRADEQIGMVGADHGRPRDPHGLRDDRQALPLGGRAQGCRTAPHREAPIGVFDSGVGGLTVLHECLVSLPEEDYLYLGDDARFPYGARSRTTCASASSATRASCSTAARS